jgi:hypothetical protein
MLRVPRPIGQKEPVKLITDRIKVVIPRQNGDRSAASHEGARNVGLGAKVEHSDPDIASRIKYVWVFCGDLVNEIFLARIPILILVGWRKGCVVPNGEAAESSSLITKEAGNSTRINPGEARNIVPRAPRVE